MADAIKSNDFAEVERLLKSGVSPEAIGSEEPPLCIAAESGDFAMVKLLLDHGAKVDTRTKSGNTPLIRAVLGSHADVVEVLLQHGAGTQVEGADGTALIQVEGENRDAIIAMLLAAGAR